MPSRCCISASRQRLQERVRNEWTDAAGECQRLGRTVKWPSGCGGRTVKGFYVACLHERSYVPIKPRNAGDGRHGEHNNIGSGWTEPDWNEGATKEWNGTKWAWQILNAAEIDVNGSSLAALGMTMRTWWNGTKEERMNEAGWRTQELPERRVGELQGAWQPAEHPKGNAAATSLNTKEICCCCIGLAGYLLNPPGERPLYRFFQFSYATVITAKTPTIIIFFSVSKI